MIRAHYVKHPLIFKVPGGTSRGVLERKDSWFLLISDGQREGIGEISVIPGLSVDDTGKIEAILDSLCRKIENGEKDFESFLQHFPAVHFGVETAMKDLDEGGKRILYPSSFTEGKDAIPINGLIWMGTPEYMKEQLVNKIRQGFRCVKIKIGVQEFKKEIELISGLRRTYNKEQLEIRVDANGAFGVKEIPSVLKQLADLDIHSIEQPIKQGQVDEMAGLCNTSPLPIALDEELIGIRSQKAKEELLGKIKPSYIILKPGLLGGFKSTMEWIKSAEMHHTGWWITSALESNVGLNAISQFTYTLNNRMTQGLGTGALYTNNIPSPLTLKGDRLYYDPRKGWDISVIGKDLMLN